MKQRHISTSGFDVTARETWQDQWSARLTTVALYLPVCLDDFCLGFSQSWMPLLDWSSRRGNLITYYRHCMSSTGCGSPERIRFRLRVLVLATGAFTASRRHISPTASVEPTTSTVVAVYTLFRLRHVGRGTDEPFNTRRPCFPSGCIKRVEWLAFSSQSRFVTVDVSSGTEDISLPVEF